MFNIYDQANKVTYPDYKSGYWQRQVPLTELAARDIYTRFTQNFGGFLDSINTWSNSDRMAGLLLDGDTLYLARVHNGGSDGSGRPQRWTLFLWRNENFASGGTVRGVVDIARWLDDAAWPVPPNNAPVPLPPDVPDVVYNAPLLPDADADARKNTASFADVLANGEVEYFPAQLEVGLVAQTPDNLAEVQRLWSAWTLSERHEKTGALLFCTVGGGFKSVHDLHLKRSIVLERRDEIERRRQAEQRRKAEEARRQEEETRRREEDEQHRKREEKRRREAEADRSQEEENKRTLCLALNIAFGTIIAAAVFAVAAHFIWKNFLQDTLTTQNPPPKHRISPAENQPSIPKTKPPKTQPRTSHP
jgi:hypothetical protein